jgi:hypothetical protein
MATVKNRTSIHHRTSCAYWCSPKKYRFCGSPICCPHLHTATAVAARNNIKGGAR